MMDNSSKKDFYDWIVLFTNACYNWGMNCYENHISGLADLYSDYDQKGLQEINRQYKEFRHMIDDSILLGYMDELVAILEEIGRMDQRIIDTYYNFFDIQNIDEKSKKRLARKFKFHRFKKRLPIPDSVIELAHESRAHKPMLEDIRLKISQRLKNLQDG